MKENRSKCSKLGKVYNTKPSPTDKKEKDIKVLINPAKNWLFTLVNPYEFQVKDEIIKHLEYQLNKYGKYIFQEEICPETGSLHIQGYIEFYVKIRPIQLGIDKRIHWGDKYGKPVKNSKKDRTNCQEYCSDRGKRIPDGKVYSNWYKEIKISNIYGWQLKLKDILLSEPERRTIHWWYSEKYGVGKSDFIRYMMFHHEAMEIEINKLSDIHHMIVDFKENNGYYPEIYIQDLPREENSETIKWENIERFKGGKFFSSKYHSCSVVMNYPTLCFLSNHKIDDYHKRLYGDRINEVCIDKLIKEENEINNILLSTIEEDTYSNESKNSGKSFILEF